MTLRWKRALLKISGEVLGGKEGPLDKGAFSFYAGEIGRARAAGAELAVVVGGGNVARGAALAFLPPTAGHTVGMLGTLLNALVLREFLLGQGIPALLMSALPVPGVAEPVDPWRAKEALAAGAVTLFAAGTGDPYVTTDTAAVIRALSVDAQVVLKASKVPGLFDDDPLRNPQAKFLPRLSHAEYLARGLRAMDGAAVAIAGENRLPIVIFQADAEGALLAALQGRRGSLIGGEG
ncbi:MAG: UMP kinase [Candidatus Bipolaricaulota bacterium]|nr:UMP kinase [Candidatus Bipolaricaulota bacterium]MCX7844779.1 UMP kinase [Candidatus Bipolaricaulota bacterium]MDW8152361.1 UMP kinase [Candidatus Bipolaricaulota bacterium]